MSTRQAGRKEKVTEQRVKREQRKRRRYLGADNEVALTPREPTWRCTPRRSETCAGDRLHQLTTRTSRSCTCAESKEKGHGTDSSRENRDRQLTPRK